MAEINEKGRYEGCTEIQMTGGKCETLPCYYNKYTGLCNFQEIMKFKGTLTLEVSQRVEDILLYS